MSTVLTKYKRTLLEEPIIKAIIFSFDGTLFQKWDEQGRDHFIAPDTVQTLQELVSRGYILGCVARTSARYLDDASFRSIFRSAVMAGGEEECKPNPSPFLAIMRDCGVTAAECALIGSKPSRDIVGSREAGIGRVFLLQNEHAFENKPCPMYADAVIHVLPEILHYFPKVNGDLIGKAVPAEMDVLFDAALSTMWWSKESDSAEDFCSKGRKLGFARFELNHQIPPSDLAAFDLNRYHIGSLHDPCPAVIPNKQLEIEDRQVASLNPTLRQSGIDTLKRTIEQAYHLGACSVVVHPGRITGDHSLDNQLRELYRKGLKDTPEYDTLREAVIADRKMRSQPHLDALLESMHVIVGFAQERGISLGLENRFHYYELPIYEEMEILLEAFPQPWVGWQLDVGHIQVHDALGLMSFQRWVERFGSRIIGIHLHDVNGIIDHRAPGSGDVNFKWLSAFLPEHALRTLEIDKSVPFEEIQRGLVVLEKSGCISRI